MSKVNVLVFPAGEINSIELHDALATCVNVSVWGASSIDRHGPYVFENYRGGLPLITDGDFFERFNALLAEQAIDLIFPTHDTVALFLVENRERINATIIAASPETTAICRDKRATYETFAGCDFVPETYRCVSHYPVFVKPREGQGSVGAKLVKSAADIPDADLDDYVICEYLPGEEYTVDCLTDKNGRLAFVSPRSRQRLMAGICVSGRIEELTPDIRAIAETINGRLSFMGLWWFQIKRDINGKWKLLEISTRCAGTMCLTRARGVNLPLLSVYTALGYDVDASPNSCSVIMDRSLIARYRIDYDYDTVYFDFDDTLIIRGKVHLKAIWFLYQCRNAGVKVILLTKHEREIYETMKEFCIDPSLFDRIIHIKPEEKKSIHIDPQRAIFVDNAYQERHDVAGAHGIPVFDVDGLDVLLDWKN